MVLKISPALKGLITASFMVVAALLIDAGKEVLDTRLQYFIFVIYALGIIWTMVTFIRTPSFTGKFGSLFNAGFRCFIIITLIMVIFTAAFIKLHPEYAETEAKYQREELIKMNTRTPDEIDELIARGKKQYAIRYISASLFGYLIFGALVTAASAAIITRIK